MNFDTRDNPFILFIASRIIIKNQKDIQYLKNF